MPTELIVTSSMDICGILFMAAVLAFIIVVFPRLQRKVGRQREGWKYLTVSVSEWIICALSFCLTAIFIWGYDVIGSARLDVTNPVLGAKILILMFAPLTAVTWWYTFSSFTRWNDDCVEQNTILIGVRTIPFSNIERVRTVASTMYIEAANGQKVKISLMHNGAHEFVKFLCSKFERKSAGKAADV